MDNTIRSGHRRLARSFNLCYRYIDSLIVLITRCFWIISQIYSSKLPVEKTTKSDHSANYLDLTFIIDSGGKLSTKLYGKCDNFDFYIVNFPFLSSDIPSGLSFLWCTHFAPHKIFTILLKITMILDIAASTWLIDFCHKAI